MKFKYTLKKELPKLAWCAIVLKNSEIVDVFHGSGIETKENFFVEGAWNGKFEQAEFDTATFFIGSGAKKNPHGKGILFSTASHTLERLYTIEDADILYVSNSMPFILYMSENELKIDYPNYELDFNTVLKGVNQYKKS